MRWSNCWIWARWMYWTRGGYLCKRRTRMLIFGRWRGWWCHYLWSQDLVTWYSFTAETYPSTVERWLGIPPPLFRGNVKRGD